MGGGGVTFHLKWSADANSTFDSGPQPYLHGSHLKSPDFPGEGERGSGVHSTPFLGGGRQNFLETRTSAKKRLHSLGDISSGSPKAGYPSY